MTKPHLKPTTRDLAINSLVSRLPFYTQGASHLMGTKHNKSYQDYGYPLTLDFWFYYAAYRRIGLARAAVKRPIDMCWLTPPKIMIDEETEDESFKEFAKRIKLWPKFRQIDELQSVGHYAGIILRIADGKTLDQPVDRIRLDDVISLMPAWEGQLIPGSLDNNPLSDRYGLPINYTYQQTGTKQAAQRDGAETFTVHHSRVLIWNEGAVGNTIYGESCLEPIYNALLDWEKVRGAGAEGFWKKAAIRVVLQSLKENTGQGPTPEQIEDLTEVITDMQNSFDAVPYLGGMELKGLQDSGSISGIDKASQIILEDVAAGRCWSAKGLVGAQEGRLAGDQDSGIDKQTAQSRRENYLNMQIQDFLDWLSLHCSDFESIDRIVEWDDLSAPSDRDRLELTEKMSRVNKEMMQEIFTPNEMRDIAGYEPLDELEDFNGGEGLENEPEEPEDE